MPLTKIPMGAVSLGNKAEDIRLTATGSLLLDLPESCGRVKTAEALLDLIRTHHLWVAREGTSQFILNLCAYGKKVTNRAVKSNVVRMLQTCEVSWIVLGS